MKVFRRGRQNWNAPWKETDAKSAKQVATDWISEEGRVLFSGTIAKEGERHTELSVEIDGKDAVEILRVLVSDYRKNTEALKGLFEAMRKIGSLAKLHYEAPSPEAFARAVEDIAMHYKDLDGLKVPPPKLNWIKWSAL